MLKFIEYVRWRSWGLVSLLAYLAYRDNDLLLIGLLIIFLIHTYFIYKNDKGVTNSDLSLEIQRLQKTSQAEFEVKKNYHKANLDNQTTIIQLLQAL